MKIIVKDYVNACGSYVIIQVENEKRPYRAVNKKYINESGFQTKELNGFQLKASETFILLIEKLQAENEIYTCINQGMTIDEALKQYALKHFNN